MSEPPCTRRGSRLTIWLSKLAGHYTTGYEMRGEEKGGNERYQQRTNHIKTDLGTTVNDGGMSEHGLSHSQTTLRPKRCLPIIQWECRSAPDILLSDCSQLVVRLSSCALSDCTRLWAQSDYAKAIGCVGRKIRIFEAGEKSRTNFWAISKSR